MPLSSWAGRGNLKWRARDSSPAVNVTDQVSTWGPCKGGTLLEESSAEEMGSEWVPEG